MPTVVLLLSDKRSGSTMLQSELCRNPAIRHVSYSPHTYSETHHWLKSAVVLERPASLFSGGRVYQGYGSRAGARAYLVDALKGNIDGYEAPDDDEALVFDGWEALCRRCAEPVFFEKSPQILAHWSALSLMLEWIGRTDMDVRVIGLVRNPLAVQYSAKELFSTEPAARQHGWVEIQRNLLAVQAMLPEHVFHMIRYEDLIADPPGRLAELCRFIGVDFDPAMGADVHAASERRWAADPDYTLQLDRASIQMARRFGYSDQELENPRRAPAGNAAAAGPTVERRLANTATLLRDRVIRPAALRLGAALGNRR